MTETRAVSSGGAAVAPPPTERRPHGLADLLGTSDHLAVGRLFVGTSLLFLLIAGVAGGVVGVDRIDGAADLVSGAYGQLLTLHGVGATFLFAIPVFCGLGIAVVPLQVGARTVAFPRAAAAAYWVWAFSGALVLVSYLINGGPGGGRLDGRLLWIVALAGVLVGLCLAAVCIATTVLALRTPGLSLYRLPMFAWSMLVASSLWLLTLPVLAGILVLTYLDTRYFAGIYDGFGNYDGLRWALGQPQVVAFALPALGVIGDIAATATGARQRSRIGLYTTIAAIGVLGIGADTFFQAVEPEVLTDPLYVGVGLALVLPLVAFTGGIGDTLRRGRLRVTGPLVLALASLLMFLAGAAAGAVRVIEPFDLVGTTADASYTHYVLLAGAIGAIAGMFHWSTKLYGVVLADGAAKAAGALLLVGTVALALPDLFSGLLDQRRGSIGDQRDGVAALDVVSVIGGVLVVLGLLSVTATVARGARAGRAGVGRDAPADPWGGLTLEWATTSPPEPGNFGAVEDVRSPEPLLDRREAQGEGPPPGGREAAHGGETN